MISGTPTAVGTSNFTVRVADLKTKTHPQEIATEAYSITVAVPAPTITRLAPTSGWTNGDTKVTILGTAFSASYQGRLRFDRGVGLRRERQREGDHGLHRAGGGWPGERHGDHAVGVDHRHEAIHLRDSALKLVGIIAIRVTSLCLAAERLVWRRAKRAGIHE